MTSTSLVQVVNQPFLYINNLNLSWNSNSTITLGAGQCRDSSNAIDMFLNGSILINAAVNGVNGLDTGSIAASTVYYVFLIVDSSNNQPARTLLSASSSAPVMPTGYDTNRRVGAVCTDASSHIIKFNQYGNASLKIMMFDADRTTLALINGGAATSFTPITAASGYIPNSCKLIIANISYNPNLAGNTVEFRPTGSSVAANVSPNYLTGQVATVILNAEVLIETNSSQSFDYQVSNGSDILKVFIKGYYDFL